MATGDKTIIASKNYVDTATENMVKDDVATTFTAPQRVSSTNEDDGSIDFRNSNDFDITLDDATDITVTSIDGCDGQSGVIVIHDRENIDSWSDDFGWLGDTPADETDLGIFSYKIVAGNLYIAEVKN